MKISKLMAQCHNRLSISGEPPVEISVKMTCSGLLTMRYNESVFSIHQASRLMARRLYHGEGQRPSNGSWPSRASIIVWRSGPYWHVSIAWHVLAHCGEKMKIMKLTREVKRDDDDSWLGKGSGYCEVVVSSRIIFSVDICGMNEAVSENYYRWSDRLLIEPSVIR